MDIREKQEKTEKEYGFYGSREAKGVLALDHPYAGIRTPADLYDALWEIWCAETCAPRMRAQWSPDNRTLGQCSVTAFLAQDIFGGEVRGMPTREGGVHCYNVVNGTVFDLTSQQFQDRAADLVYGADPVQERESPAHFGKEEKRKRYELLRAALAKKTAASVCAKEK